VPAEEKKLSVVGVAVLGIGSMVGAGIFALLGEAAVVAGSAVWLSFLLAGGVTILLAYNVIKLGIRYPSSGGLIEYLRQGFELPRAMLLALGITTTTYVLIALGVFGTLTVDEAIGYGETAIAEAARPALGDAGFTIMAVAALLATAGSTNATLFASKNLTAELEQIGQFPPFFGPRSRLGPHAGLLISTGLVLLVANLVDLSAIASVGSACSLLVFLLVGVAAYRRRSETGANLLLILLGLAATVVVLVAFALDTLENAPETFTAIVGITLLAVAADFVWKRMRPPGPVHEPPLIRS